MRLGIARRAIPVGNGSDPTHLTATAELAAEVVDEWLGTVCGG